MTFKQVALKTMILISFGCIANSGYSQTTSAIGRVSGKIVDDKGGPAAGSSVTLRTNGTAKVETFRTVTAKDGTYQFTAVPAGIYSLCVQADSQGSHLNPCMWSDKPQTVTVPKTGGAIVSNPVVEKGVSLRIRINDPNKALERKSPTSPVLLIGVWSPLHIFYPLTQVSKDAGGATYQATVPHSTDLKVSLHGPAIQMQLDRAPAVSGASTSIPVRVDSSASVKNMTIDVLGPAK